MLVIEKNKNLKPLNTFGIEVYSNYFTQINSIDDLKKLLTEPVYLNNPRLILGGGSNILFTKNFEGLILKNNIKGISIAEETSDFVIIKSGAGENWHDLVLYTIKNNYGGIENLSLIPGCVGASPMQNIGAYGVEIKDVFYALTAFNLVTGELVVFNNVDCKFGYRESIFKNELKNKYIIVDVSFKLFKKHQLNTSYGAIKDELLKMGITSPTLKDVSNAVIAIRQSKLPNPKEIGNAGSFFKNPEVSAEKFLSLKAENPNLVAYPLDNGNYKLAAGWLIEQCGLKGYEQDGAGVHKNQALVLINKNNTNGKHIFDLSTHVLQTVALKFGVTLEREVNII